MKTTKLNRLSKNIFLAILITMMIFSLPSCVKKMTFLNSSVVPAAKGFVNVKSDKNKNYVIKVHVSNLAEATRLQPSKKTYVVWAVTTEGNTDNMGQLKSSKKLLSKQMNATFETVSSSKPAKIFITAENEGNIQYPGEQIILTTENFIVNR